MLARVTSAAARGIDAHPVQVEVDVCNGLPQTRIEGLPDWSVAERWERVRSAIGSSGIEIPPRVIVVRLEPAPTDNLTDNIGNFDLAMAIGLLAGLGQLPQDALDGRLFIGELFFNGTIRPVAGALAVSKLAAHLGMGELLLPAANATEAAAADCVTVVPVRTLREALDHLTE